MKPSLKIFNCQIFICDYSVVLSFSINIRMPVYISPIEFGPILYLFYNFRYTTICFPFRTPIAELAAMWNKRL